MKERDKIIRWGALVIIMVAATSAFFVGEAIMQERQLRDNESKLQVLHWVYPIERGEIKSPAVIIELKTAKEFDEKYRELNVSVVYLDFSYSPSGWGGWSPELYVFNEDYSLAWCWTLEPIPTGSKYVQGGEKE